MARNRLTGLVAVLLLLTVVAVPAVATAGLVDTSTATGPTAPDTPTAGVGDIGTVEETESQLNEQTAKQVSAVAEQPGQQSVGNESKSDRIGPNVQATGETEEVVVRFEPRDNQGVATATADIKSHADQSKEPFRRFVEGNPHVTIKQEFWIANAALVEVDTRQMAFERLLEVQNVERVHENFEVTVTSATRPATAERTADLPTAINSVPGDTSTYGLDMVSAQQTWQDFDAKGDGVTVAVLDTGVDDGHEDLSVAKWAHFDATGSRLNTQPQDGNGHGTHVAGTVAGGNASGKAIGVAPDTNIYGVKVLGDDGSGTFTQIVAGMEWATTNNDVDVIQMSLGSSGTYDSYIEPVRNARDNGKIVVASSGNDGSGTSGSPGNVYDSLAVGAVDSNEDVAQFSSGETIDTDADWNSPPSDWPSTYVVPDVTAPGSDIESAYAGTADGTIRLDGTSMAAPHVSGVAALVQDATTRELTDEELQSAIIKSAEVPDGETTGTRYGQGIVDAHDATLTATPDEFDVSVTGTNDPVVAGENLSVDAEIQNLKPSGTTQTIELRYDDNGDGTANTVADSVPVTLDPGKSQTVTLDWATTGGDSTVDQVTVASADTSTTESVTVKKPPTFEVTLDNVDSEVTAGEDITVDYTVENTGDVEGTQDIELLVGSSGGAPEKTTQTTISGGQRTNGTFTYTTTEEEIGEVAVTVNTEDDSSEQTVTVNEPPTFEVTLDSVPEAVTARDTLAVDYTITNTGDIEGTKNVELRIDSGSGFTTEASTQTTLTSGESASGTLTYDTVDGDVPDVTANVWTEDDNSQQTVTVKELNAFFITVEGTNAPVVAGEQLNVTAKIENTKDETNEQTIELQQFDGTGVDSQQVSLGPGEMSTVDLSWETGTGDAGTNDVTVSSEDYDAAETVTLWQPPDLQVTSVTPQAPVVEGEDLDVDVTVENVGEVAGTQEVALSVDRGGTLERVDSQQETVAGGATSTVTRTYTTKAGDAPTVTLKVATDNDSGTADATVQEPADLQVSSITPQNPVTVGDILTVDASVENTGDVEGTGDVALEVSPAQNGSFERVDTETVTVSGGATSASSLDYATRPNDPSKIDVQALMVAGGSGVTGTVTVNEGPYFEVTPDIDSSVVEGETLEIGYTVENVGQQKGTQSVAVNLNGSTAATNEYTLGPGETKTDTVTYSTVNGDLPALEVAIESDDDSAVETVDVLEVGNLTVANVDAPAEAAQGGTVDVTATLSNDGEVPLEQDVTLNAGGKTVATKSASVDPGTEQVTLTYDVPPQETGDVTLTVSTDDGSGSATVTVLEVGDLVVDSLDAPGSVVQGSQLTVGADLKNTGETSLTQTVQFTVSEVGGGEITSQTTETTVGPNETGNVSFNYTISNSRESDVVVEITADDKQNETVTVLKQADLRVTDISTNSPITEGETLSVDATVENVGDVETTQDVTLKVDTDPPGIATEVDSTTETVGGGASTTVALAYKTKKGDASAVDAIVATEDNRSDAARVTVSEAAYFDVSIETIDDEVDVGDDIDVAYRVKNTGGASGSQSIKFTINEEVNATNDVSLGADNATGGLSFNYTTTSDDTPLVNVGVESADDEVTLGVDVVGEDEDSGSSGGGGGRGGSGGGQAPPPDSDDEEEKSDDVDIERADTSDIERDREANTSTATLDDSLVKEIRFDNPSVEGRVRALELKETPDSTGEPRGETVSALEVTVPEDAADTSATLLTEVSKERVENIGADPENLRVMRYTDEWETLNTSVIEETDTTVRLEAETPGFSYFAVSAVPQPEAAFDVSAESLGVNETLTVDATRSSYDEGDIKKYEWETAGKSYTGRAAEIPFDEPGEYAVELTVTSEDKTTDSKTVTIVVDSDGTNAQTDGNKAEGDADGGTDEQPDDETSGESTGSEEADDGGGILGLVLGLLQTVLLYLGVPVLVIFLGLKGLAYYLGY